MTRNIKSAFSQLETGYQFSPSSLELNSATVSAYLTAVEDGNELYRDDNIIPPLKIAACAMEALFDDITLPEGTIHISQELEFSATASTDDNLTSHARVTRRQTRGKLNMLTISFEIINQQQQTVLTGKTSLILPETEAGQ